MSYHKLIILLCLFVGNCCWGVGGVEEDEKKLSAVLVTGTLLCGHYNPLPLSGASVAVSCLQHSDCGETITGEFGDFVIQLPSRLHGIPYLEDICLVRVTELPDTSHCSNSTFTDKHERIVLSYIGQGYRTYTADPIHIKPNPPKYDDV